MRYFDTVQKPLGALRLISVVLFYVLRIVHPELSEGRPKIYIEIILHDSEQIMDRLHYNYGQNF